MKFIKEPGDRPYAQLDGGVATVWGEPDTVTLPNQLGGQTERILDIFTSPCVQCKKESCKHYKLETVGVCECTNCCFVWYKVR